MKRAIVIYHSKTGPTKKYRDSIRAYLRGKGIDVHVTSTTVLREKMLNGDDYIFFSC